MVEFQTLIDALRATQRGSVIQPSMDHGDLNRRISCPKCHRPMEAHSYAGPGNVVIDSCEPCSLNWLDHGELARIAQAPDDRGPDADYRDPDADRSDDQATASDSSDDTFGSLGWKLSI
jgi:Zn-finger nucleic acid-binding protein